MSLLRASPSDAQIKISMISSLCVSNPAGSHWLFKISVGNQISHIIALRIGLSLPPLPAPLLAAVVHEDVEDGDEESEEGEDGEGVAAARVTRVARCATNDSARE